MAVPPPQRTDGTLRQLDVKSNPILEIEMAKTGTATTASRKDVNQKEIEEDRDLIGSLGAYELKLLAGLAVFQFTFSYLVFEYGHDALDWLGRLLRGQ